MQRSKLDVEFLGVLATNEEVYDSIGRHKAVFINKQNYLQFYIKVINIMPESFPRNQTLFTCYSSDLEKYGFVENYHESEYNRIIDLTEFLMDSLILFKPYKKVLPNHEEVYNTADIRLIPKLETYKFNQQFMAIPIFSDIVHKMTKEEFQNALIHHKYVGTVDGISNEPNDTPSVVLWKEDNNFTSYGLFDKHDYAHGGFSFISNDGIRGISFNSWLNKVYREGNEDDTLLFVDSETYTEIEEEHRKASSIVAELLETLQLEPNKTVLSDEELTIEKRMTEDITIKTEGEIIDREEDLFMEHFINVTREMGLQYFEKDLYNFHTAMKSNSLTILAGMSGTGKSKLVQAYAKALGVDKASQQLVFIPVQPSWTDNTDLLGYVDTKNMLYRPSDTSLVDALFQAQNERNKLFIICFDEMNLSRVEHYFSQFLSVLEMEPNQRMLRLYSDRLEQQIYNSAQYGSKINIGPNVVFVGTVNLDESTYHFSDKVLDRANVISLDVQSYDMLKSHNTKDANKTRKPYTFELYNKFKKQEGPVSLTDEELNFLWDLHLLMQNENKNLGIGPRVVKQIDHYLKNLPRNKYFERKEAFDLQVVQRILTKLRGPEGMLKGLIGKINEGKNDGQLYELIERYSNVSEFSKTKDTIIQKAKELKVNGFTV